MRLKSIKGHYLRLFFCLIVTLGLLQACSKSTLISSWVNESCQKPIKGPILVIGVYQDPVAHKIYEDSFVEELHKVGQIAIPSYDYGLAPFQPSKDKLQEIIKRTGASTILITHLLSEDSGHYQFPEKHYAYASTLSWDQINGYHSAVYAETWGGNKTVDKTVDCMEATLFDGATGEYIWSARSKSVNLEKLLRKDDEQLEEVFIKDMQRHKLL